MRQRLPLLALLTCFRPVSADPTPETTIPFELKEHLIVVRAEIGDLSDIRLAVDTGASTSIISPRLARRLRLDVERERTVLILGRSVKIKEVVLPRLCLGDICHERTLAQVSPLHFVPVDGLLGLDALTRTSLTIDFESRQIRLGSVPQTGTSQRFVPQLPFLIARVKIAERTLCLLLDSGCGELVLFQRRVLGRLPMERTGERIPLEASGVRAKAEIIFLKGVSLGDCRWKSLQACLLNDRKTDRYGNLDGILGLGVLDLKQIAFDFDHNRVFWEQE